MRILYAILLMGVFSSPSLAQEVELVPISEVMPNATAMTTVANELLFISTKNRGYMCIVTVTGSYAEGLLKNDLRGTNVPKGTCVDVATFTTHADE